MASRAAHPPSSAGEPSSVHGRKGAGERRLKTPAAWARACVHACSAGFHKNPAPSSLSKVNTASLACDQESPWRMPPVVVT